MKTFKQAFLSGIIFSGTVIISLVWFTVYAWSFDGLTSISQTWFNLVNSKLNWTYTSWKMCTSDWSWRIQCITDIPVSWWLGTYNLSQNWYQKFSNGLIIQWWTTNVKSTTTEVAFPIAFPNNYFNVTVQKNRGTSWHWASLWAYEIALHEITKTWFKTYIHFDDANFTYNWMAIGN
jgi:hypothetical protein